MRERDLLNHIFAANPHLPDRVTIPPGDDMGAVRLRGFGDRELLVTVDQVADGVHVNTKTTPLDLIGRKAITRNLSDVAAMAARPVAAVAAAALPRDFVQARADALFDAMRTTAEHYDCWLIGGDVTIWDHPLLLSVTVFAEPHPVRGPVLRSGAQPGDAIYVTGQLGGAWDESGGGAHLHFEPRIQLARQLAEQLGVDLHAMIDLSDGLATDLAHICRMSRVGAELDSASIPLRDAAAGSVRRGLTDGEDYELCFTIADAAKLPDAIDGAPITRIGRIVESPTPQVWLIERGGRIPLDAAGWEHH